MEAQTSMLRIISLAIIVFLCQVLARNDSISSFTLNSLKDLEVTVKLALESKNSSEVFEKLVPQMKYLVDSMSDSLSEQIYADDIRIQADNKEKKHLNLRFLSEISETIYGSQSDTAAMATLLDELLTRKMPKWLVSHSGWYIKDGNVLKQRLELARSKFGRDCRRNNILLFTCSITKFDDSDLQEWLVWQIVVVGVHHVILYLNDASVDNTMLVLRPFIDAGHVTVIDFKGLNRQNVVYGKCMDLIRRKGCHYDPLKHSSLEEVQDCAPFQDYDVYQGTDRVVWMNTIDTDEFPLDISGKCFVDNLKPFEPDNGLMVPWYLVGHSDLFLTQNHLLVTEAYTRRLSYPVAADCYINVVMGKSFNRVYSIARITEGHTALFRNSRPALNEYRNLSDHKDMTATFDFAHYEANLRLYHFLTKSVEHLMKKFLRGTADLMDKWGRPYRRHIDQIVAWVKMFADDRFMVRDESLLPYAKIVRFVLTGSDEHEP